MLDSFLTFINQRNWNLAGTKTLLTVSGGIDSVVMLHLFHKAGFDVGIAHCNFGLRGQESIEDEHFVRSLATYYGYQFHTVRFDTKAYVEQHAVSTQMAARSLRYEWFEQLRSEFQYQWIATAHHANDSFETSLINLVRGTGIAGLDGVPHTSGNIIRPLLFATRAEIEAYLKENHLSWREDRSNASLDYGRNMIRHDVVPVLRKLNPSLEHTFRTTSERLADADALLSDYLSAWADDISVIEENLHSIFIKKLLAFQKPSYGLWHILQQYGFTYEQSKQITDALKGIPGKRFFSKTHVVLRDREMLLISKRLPTSSSAPIEISADDTDYHLSNGTLSVVTQDTNLPLSFDKNANTGFFDLDLLQFPLTLRNWQQGDWFVPFGMKGKRKKLSDLFSDAKVSLLKKEEIPVLVNGNGEIIWVVGMRTDERFKITETTKRVFVVTYSPDL